MTKILALVVALALVVVLPISASANTSILPEPFQSVTSPIPVEWEIFAPASGDTPDFTIFHDNQSTLVSYGQILEATPPSSFIGDDILIYNFDGFSFEEPNIVIFDSTILSYYDTNHFSLISTVNFAPNDYFSAVDVSSSVRTKPFYFNRNSARVSVGIVWADRHEEPDPFAIPNVDVTVKAFDTAGTSYAVIRSVFLDGLTDRYNLTPLLLEAREALPSGRTFAYYTIEASCNGGAIPCIGSSNSIIQGQLSPDVVAIESPTFYVTQVDYEDFNLLTWLGSALDGFMSSTLFELGSVNVTFGMLIGTVLGLSVFIAFLKKFAGG